MFIKNFQNALAVAGVLLVLVALSVATRTAFADEAAAVSSTHLGIQSAVVVSRAAAKSAHRDAADAAVNSVALDNQLDLDLDIDRLGRKSLLVARSRQPATVTKLPASR